MIRKGALLIGLIGLSISSCTDHEVIPAPEREVELSCRFEGNIGGQFIEYTENVEGYAGFPTIAKQTESGETDAQYYFAMTSTEYVPYIQIGLGSLTWADASGTQNPALSLFNDFFIDNDEPLYSNGALNGFEVLFHAYNGTDWRSDETSIEVMNVAAQAQEKFWD